MRGSGYRVWHMGIGHHIERVGGSRVGERITNMMNTKLEYMYLNGLLSPSPCLDCILVCLWARNVRRTCSTV